MMAFSNASHSDARHSTFNNIHVGQNQIIFNGRDILEKLEPVKMDASRRTECLPNTRTDILEFVADWANDARSEQKILWIHGLAGSGKSALATTIANTFRDSGRLGAFLFFDRDVTERSNPGVVIRTLAYQLGTSDPRIGAAMRTAIEKNPNVTISPLSRQFQKLVLEPLSELGPISPTIVIVLDALDECGAEDEREALLTVLAQDFVDHPFVIRAIITSRAEIDIRNAFGSQDYTLAYELDITSPRNSDDILSYCQHRMTLIRTKRRHLPLGADWPGTAVLHQLVQRASGLFVWASTASKFIDGHDPTKRLDIILSGDAKSGAEAALDALYKTALDSVGCWDDEDFVADFRAIMGTILLAREPLSSSAIDALLCLPENRPCMNTISFLCCLLQQTPTVRVLHPSFADFLTTEERCRRDIWFFDQSAHHHRLASVCLDRMDAVLERNMCNMTLAADLVTESLAEDVSYSCVFWIDHICAIQADITPIVDRLRDFLFRHLLHWFEAMSILKRSRDTISRLNRLLVWILIHSSNETLLLALVRDACRFAQLFGHSMEAHPLLVYMSALPFTPTNTILYQTFHRPDVYPSITGDFQHTWSPLSLAITGHMSDVTSVAVSSDGTRIVSTSYDGTIRIWDSTTGAEVKEILVGVTVWSVALSSDGHRIVSGSDDGTVRVWDAMSGMEVSKMLGHDDAVLSVDISPNGCRIVSGSRDSTIRVWVATTGTEALPTVRRHIDSVMCVAFSPDGKAIASGSRDRTVRVWDAKTGVSVFPALRGHVSDVNSVKFSPGGDVLISGSVDNTIRVWDSMTGLQMLVLRGHETSVNSVAFSPDGQRIISGSSDETIRVWDVTTGTQLLELPRHPVPIRSVDCSPDGCHIISGGNDNIVRTWDITMNTDEVLTAPRHHGECVDCIAFSPDGRRIVSGSLNGTLIIWDAISGAALFEIPEGSTGWMQSVAFSKDGSCIICKASYDTIYDAASGHQLHDLYSVEEFDNSLSDSIKITDGGWIIDSSTGRTICELPPMVMHSCHAAHETSIAVGMASGRLLVIRFPPDVFTPVRLEGK